MAAISPSKCRRKSRDTRHKRYNLAKTMPFSIAEQLRLLGPALFEELCGRLLPADAHKAEGSGGDQGIDFFRGTLDPSHRVPSASFEIWQAKFFRDGLKGAQKKQVLKSLESARLHKPTRWILMLP